MMAQLDKETLPEEVRRIPLRRDWSQLIDDLRYVGSTAVQISNELSTQSFCGIDASRLLSGECVNLRHQQFYLDAAVNSWSHAFAAEQLDAAGYRYAVRIYNSEDDCLLVIQLDGESARDHFEALVSLYADNNSVPGSDCARCERGSCERSASCQRMDEPALAFDPALVPELLEVLTDNAMPLLVSVEKAHARHCYEGVLSCFRQYRDACILFDQGYSLSILHAKIGRACLSSAGTPAGCRAVQLYDARYRRALTLALSPCAAAAEVTKWRKITASLATAAGTIF